jgi:predicted site-specific integrase-resolvase
MDKKTSTMDALVVDQQAAADLLGISVSTLRRWHRDGKGPRAIKMSRLIRYRPRDLQQFVLRCEQEASTRPGRSR